MSQRKRESILDRFKDDLTKPTLTEKVNFEYRIGRGLDAIQLAILIGETETIDNAISALFAMIPESWYGEEFFEDIENAKILYEESVQDSFCGYSWGDLYVLEKESTDKFLILLACINLFDRLGLLIRKTEKAVI